MAIKRRKWKNTPLGGPRWAISNDLHLRFSAAFCPGEQLLCGWLPQQGFDLRSLAPHTLSGFTAKTNSFKYSFFPHSVELWNSLPSDVALANYNSFKNSILNIL